MKKYFLIISISFLSNLSYNFAQPTMSWMTCPEATGITCVYSRNFRQIIPQSGGGYIAVMTIARNCDGFSNEYRTIFITYNANGTEVSRGVVPNSYEFISVIQTADGGFAMAGNTIESFPRMVIQKFNASYGVVWTQILNNQSGVSGSYIEQTSNGGYIVGGQLAGLNAIDFATAQVNNKVLGGGDICLVRLDANGNIVWKRIFGSSGADGFKSVHRNADGTYLICGSVGANNGDVTGGSGAWVAKISTTGNDVLWEKTINIGGGTVGAFENSDGTFDAIAWNPGNYTAYFYQLNGDNGATMRSNTMGDLSFLTPKNVFRTAAQDILLIGKYTPQEKMFIRKINQSNFSTAWTKHFNYFENQFDQLKELDNGNIVVGVTMGSTNNEKTYACANFPLTYGSHVWLFRLEECSSGDIALLSGRSAPIRYFCPSHPSTTTVKVMNNSSCFVEKGSLTVNLAWTGANVGSATATNDTVIMQGETREISIPVTLTTKGQTNFTATINYSKDNTPGNNTVSFSNLPVTSNTIGTNTANQECDENTGWTHYYRNDNPVLSIFKDDNAIGTLATNLTVTSTTTANFGTQATAFSPLPPYTNNPTWRASNRYWNVTTNLQPLSDVTVRYYFNQRDMDDMSAAFVGMSLTPQQLFFYKINGTANPNPALGHTNVAKATGYNQTGFWQYTNGNAVTNSTWKYGSIGASLFYGEFKTASFSGGGIGFSVGALSAELLDFQALKKDKTVQLQWQTATERNVSHFEIERSNDGTVFSKIMEEKAKGGTQPTIYTVQDGPPQYGTHYYRLKIVDNDGKAAVSKTVSLTFGKNLIVRTFPNPVANELTIEVETAAKMVDISVVDVLGRVVFSKNTEGANSLKINTTHWQSGIYILKISDNATRFQQKIVKQ